MTKDAGTKRYSSEERRALRAAGGDRSDWARVDARTEAVLEAAIAEDRDWRDIPRDWWKDAVAVTPGAKKLISLRLDPDVVAWFRAQGPGYQARINAVLRAYRRAAAKTP